MSKRIRKLWENDILWVSMLMIITIIIVMIPWQ